MMGVKKSNAEFFEAKYRQNSDPWSFASNPYELRRYDAIIAALDFRRYDRAFEPGCSIGILTERLAAICAFVTAVDFSPSAVKSAMMRCRDVSNVEVKCLSINEDVELEGTDLVVLSEIGYYQDPKTWRATVEHLLMPMRSGGTILAAHWLGKSADHKISGDMVHEILTASPLLHLEHSERNEVFRLDRWVRV